MFSLNSIQNRSIKVYSMLQKQWIEFRVQSAINIFFEAFTSYSLSKLSFTYHLAAKGALKVAEIASRSLFLRKKGQNLHIASLSRESTKLLQEKLQEKFDQLLSNYFVTKWENIPGLKALVHKMRDSLIVAVFKKCPESLIAKVDPEAIHRVFDSMSVEDQAKWIESLVEGGADTLISRALDTTKQRFNFLGQSLVRDSGLLDNGDDDVFFKVEKEEGHLFNVEVYFGSSRNMIYSADREEELHACYTFKGVKKESIDTLHSQLLRQEEISGSKVEGVIECIGQHFGQKPIKDRVAHTISNETCDERVFTLSTTRHLFHHAHQQQKDLAFYRLYAKLLVKYAQLKDEGDLLSYIQIAKQVQALLEEHKSQHPLKPSLAIIDSLKELLNLINIKIYHKKREKEEVESEILLPAHFWKLFHTLYSEMGDNKALLNGIHKGLEQVYGKEYIPLFSAAKQEYQKLYTQPSHSTSCYMENFERGTIFTFCFVIQYALFAILSLVFSPIHPLSTALIFASSATIQWGVPEKLWSTYQSVRNEVFCAFIPLLMQIFFFIFPSHIKKGILQLDAATFRANFRGSEQAADKCSQELELELDEEKKEAIETISSFRRELDDIYASSEDFDPAQPPRKKFIYSKLAQQLQIAGKQFQNIDEVVKSFGFINEEFYGKLVDARRLFAGRKALVEEFALQDSDEKIWLKYEIRSDRKSPLHTVIKSGLHLCKSSDEGLGTRHLLRSIQKAFQQTREECLERSYVTPAPLSVLPVTDSPFSPDVFGRDVFGSPVTFCHPDEIEQVESDSWIMRQWKVGSTLEEIESTRLFIISKGKELRDITPTNFYELLNRLNEINQNIQEQVLAYRKLSLRSIDNVKAFKRCKKALSQNFAHALRSLMGVNISIEVLSEKELKEFCTTLSELTQCFSFLTCDKDRVYCRNRWEKIQHVDQLDLLGPVSLSFAHLHYIAEKLIQKRYDEYISMNFYIYFLLHIFKVSTWSFTKRERAFYHEFLSKVAQEKDHQLYIKNAFTDSAAHLSALSTMLGVERLLNDMNDISKELVTGVSLRNLEVAFEQHKKSRECFILCRKQSKKVQVIYQLYQSKCGMETTHTPLRDGTIMDVSLFSEQLGSTLSFSDTRYIRINALPPVMAKLFSSINVMSFEHSGQDIEDWQSFLAQNYLEDAALCEERELKSDGGVRGYFKGRWIVLLNRLHRMIDRKNLDIKLADDFASFWLTQSQTQRFDAMLDQNEESIQRIAHLVRRACTVEGDPFECSGIWFFLGWLNALVARRHPHLAVSIEDLFDEYSDKRYKFRVGEWLAHPSPSDLSEAELDRISIDTFLAPKQYDLKLISHIYNYYEEHFDSRSQDEQFLRAVCKRVLPLKEHFFDHCEPFYFQDKSIVFRSNSFGIWYALDLTLKKLSEVKDRDAHLRGDDRLKEWRVAGNRYCFIPELSSQCFDIAMNFSQAAPSYVVKTLVNSILGPFDLEEGVTIESISRMRVLRYEPYLWCEENRDEHSVPPILGDFARGKQLKVYRHQNALIYEVKVGDAVRYFRTSASAPEDIALDIRGIEYKLSKDQYIKGAEIFGRYLKLERNGKKFIYFYRRPLSVDVCTQFLKLFHQAWSSSISNALFLVPEMFSAFPHINELIPIEGFALISIDSQGRLQPKSVIDYIPLVLSSSQPSLYLNQLMNKLRLRKIETTKDFAPLCMLAIALSSKQITTSHSHLYPSTLRFLIALLHEFSHMQRSKKKQDKLLFLGVLAGAFAVYQSYIEQDFFQLNPIGESEEAGLVLALLVALDPRRNSQLKSTQAEIYCQCLCRLISEKMERRIHYLNRQFPSPSKQDFAQYFFHLVRHYLYQEVFYSAIPGMSYRPPVFKMAGHLCQSIVSHSMNKSIESFTSAPLAPTFDFEFPLIPVDVRYYTKYFEALRDILYFDSLSAAHKQHTLKYFEDQELFLERKSELTKALDQGVFPKGAAYKKINALQKARCFLEKEQSIQSVQYREFVANCSAWQVEEDVQVGAMQTFDWIKTQSINGYRRLKGGEALSLLGLKHLARLVLPFRLPYPYTYLQALTNSLSYLYWFPQQRMPSQSSQPYEFMSQLQVLDDKLTNALNNFLNFPPVKVDEPDGLCYDLGLPHFADEAKQKFYQQRVIDSQIHHAKNQSSSYLNFPLSHSEQERFKTQLKSFHFGLQQEVMQLQRSIERFASRRVSRALSVETLFGDFMRPHFVNHAMNYYHLYESEAKLLEQRLAILALYQSYLAKTTKALNALAQEQPVHESLVLLIENRNYALTQQKEFALSALLFEARCNMWLRPLQVQQMARSYALHNSQSGRSSVVVEMIPGSGKSVFGMIIDLFNSWSPGRAIFAVLPKELFASTKEQFATRFERFCSRDTHIFSLKTRLTSNRELEVLLNKMRQSSEKGDLLLTTKEELQAVEMLYIETYAQAQMSSPRGLVLREMLKIIKNSHVAADEGHKQLEVSVVEKYPLGDKKFLSQPTIWSIQFFTRCLLRLSSKNLQELMEDRHYLASLMMPMIDEITNAPVFKLNIAQKEALKGFLLNYSLSYPEQLPNDENHEIFCMFRGLLRMTFSEIDDDNTHTTIDQETIDVTFGKAWTALYVIPYEGNNTPLMNSHFESPHVALLLTYIYYLIQGLDENSILRFKSHMKEKVKSESIKYGVTAENTPTMQFIIRHCGAPLASLNSEEISHNQALIFYYVNHIVAPKINYYEKSIVSTSANFAFTPLTSTYFSGTVFNRFVYHDFATYCRAMETTSQTLEAMFKGLSKGGIELIAEGPKNQQREEFINAVCTDPNCMVVIDAAPLFNGEKNASVARAILEGVKETRTDIEAVVFFDELDNLKYFKVGDDEVYDNIEDIDIEKRVCYLDHKHTFGVDIPQKENASSRIAIGCTPLFESEQASWRLRGIFTKSQYIYCSILPVAHREMRVLGYMSEYNHCSASNLIHFMTGVELEKLTPLVAQAGMQKLNAIARKHSMSLDLNHGVNLFDTFRDSMVTEVSFNPVERYGRPRKQVSAIDHLRACKAQMKERVLKCRAMTKDQKRDMIADIEAVNEQFLPKSILVCESGHQEAHSHRVSHVSLTQKTRFEMVEASTHQLTKQDVKQDVKKTTKLSFEDKKDTLTRVRPEYRHWPEITSLDPAFWMSSKRELKKIHCADAREVLRDSSRRCFRQLAYMMVPGMFFTENFLEPIPKTELSLTAFISRQISKHQEKGWHQRVDKLLIVYNHRSKLFQTIALSAVDVVFWEKRLSLNSSEGDYSLAIANVLDGSIDSVVDHSVAIDDLMKEPNFNEVMLRWQFYNGELSYRPEQTLRLTELVKTSGLDLEGLALGVEELSALREGTKPVETTLSTTVRNAHSISKVYEWEL